MRIWVIKVGEPLPIDGARYRPHRIGMLADELLSRGHEVIWWASTLDHATKKLRYEQDTNLQVRDRYQVRLLHSIGYKNNVSLRRLFDHAQAANKFRRTIESQPKPDLIWCCLPTIELSDAAVQFGRKHNIPVVLDVRDLWPDNFLSVIPGRLRHFADFVLLPYVRKTRQAFRDCTAVVGISEGYLQWGLGYAGRRKREKDATFPLGYQRPSVPEAQILGAGAAMTARGVDSSRLICWFVGMFGKTYDLQTVIAAARQFFEQGIEDVQFVLSGAGEAQGALEAQAGGLPNVVFTGRINAVELAYMGQIAGIGLMAYAKGAPQGMPNKLFEYMCAGLPIVSSLEGETAGVLEQHRCGLSYGAGDFLSLAAAIDTLRRDMGERLRMGENGKIAFERFYAAEKIYPRIAHYIEDLAQPFKLHAGMAASTLQREETHAKAA